MAWKQPVRSLPGLILKYFLEVFSPLHDVVNLLNCTNINAGIKQRDDDKPHHLADEFPTLAIVEDILHNSPRHFYKFFYCSHVKKFNNEKNVQPK
jgi:hypothetical protein